MSGIATRSAWRPSLGWIARYPIASIGALLCILIVIGAVGAPWLAPYDPNDQNIIERLSPPSGDFLFGTWCAADIMYAPVVTGFITYGVPVPPFAGLYMKAVLSHPHVNDWIDKAQDEPWVIDHYESESEAA